MKMSKEFLPLGSAIKWKKDEESIYIIISRAFMQPPEQEMIAGYQCSLYPQGYAKDSRVYIVKETEISEVLTKGYTDDLDIDFAKQKVEELTERIQNAPSVAPTAEQSKVEVSNNNGLTHEEMLAKDPFYKFRKMKESEKR
jgi:Uncharacterized protein conserved in bacteria